MSAGKPPGGPEPAATAGSRGPGPSFTRCPSQYLRKRCGLRHASKIGMRRAPPNPRGRSGWPGGQARPRPSSCHDLTRRNPSRPASWPGPGWSGHGRLLRRAPGSVLRGRRIGDFGVAPPLLGGDHRRHPHRSRAVSWVYPTIAERSGRWAWRRELLLAGHFWAWIASVQLTTIANSAVLVSTQPLFVAGFSVWFLREHPAPRQWLGIIVAVIGAGVIGWGDFALGGTALVGDGLAILASIMAAGYFSIGRSLRQKLDLWAYTGLVYGAAAVILTVGGSGQPRNAPHGLSRHRTGRCFWLWPPFP